MGANLASYVDKTLHGSRLMDRKVLPHGQKLSREAEGVDGCKIYATSEALRGLGCFESEGDTRRNSFMWT